MGRNFLHLPEVDSTNNFLKKNLSNFKPLPEGTVIMADKQTAGRGQKTTKWQSEPGKNITASILLYPNFLHASQQFDLNRTISLALCEAIEPILSTEISIKWPNDLYVNDKKLCGILIENSLSGIIIRSSVIGFGVNVNQNTFPPGCGNPVSMIQISLKQHDLMEIMQKICLSVEAYYLQLRSGKTDKIRQDYDDKLYRKQESHLFNTSTGSFTGKITGTTPQGLLKIDTQNGLRLFDLKELRFVI